LRKALRAAFCLLCLSTVCVANSLLAEDSTVCIRLEDYGKYKPKIAYALSGGGARGIAQIGVFQEFEKIGVYPDYVVGTSIGSIIGGLYSSGYTAQELDSIVLRTNWENVFAASNENDRTEYFMDQKLINDRSILSFRFDNFKFIIPEAISLGIKYTYYLQNLLWNGIYQPFNNFDDLKYKFRAVATDVLSGESISFKDGNIVSVIKASSTLPLRYTPVRIDDKILVDGGIMANLPTLQAEEFNPDLIIAVKSTSPLFNRDELDKPWNLADQVVSVAMKKFESNAEHYADFVLYPNIGSHKNTDFSNLDSLIEQGRLEARRYAPAILKRIETYKDSVLENTLKPVCELINKTKNIRFETRGLEFTDSIKFRTLNLVFDKGEFVKVIKSCSNYKRLDIKTRRASADSSALIVVEGEKKKSVKYVRLESNYQNIVDKISDSLNIELNSKLVLGSNKKKIQESLLKRLVERGYNLCSISDSLSYFRNDTLNLYVTIPRIKDIIIKGNTTIGDFLIKRDITFKKGDFINANNLCKSWENVYNMGWFSGVDLKLDLNEAKTEAIVYMKVKELGTQVLNIGLRSDNERKTKIGVDVIQDNIFNFGTRFNARISGGERDFSLFGAIEQSRIMDTYITFKLSSYYNFKRMYNYLFQSNIAGETFKYLKLTDYASQAYGIKFNAGRQLERNGLLGVEFRFEKQRFYEWNIDRKYIPAYYSINSVKFETVFDTEDKTDFPTKGRVIGLSLETTINSDINYKNFSKAIIEFRSNHTAKRHTFIPSVYFGFADISTPLPEFFDLGGQDKFFGLFEDQEKGRQIVKGSLEYRYKSPFSIFFDTYLLIRYDIGAIWITPDDVKFDNLKHGIGATLAFDTPVGPAKFSVGKCLYINSETSKAVYGPLALYFGIGLKF
jgi:NTE family protein